MGKEIGFLRLMNTSNFSVQDKTGLNELTQDERHKTSASPSPSEITSIVSTHILEFEKLIPSVSLEERRQRIWRWVKRIDASEDKGGKGGRFDTKSPGHA